MIAPADAAIIIVVAMCLVYWTIKRHIENKHRLEIEKLKIRKFELQNEAKVWEGLKAEKQTEIERSEEG